MPGSPPLVELTGRIVGHLPCRELHERDGSLAYPGVMDPEHRGSGSSTGTRSAVEAGKVRPVEPPDACAGMNVMPARGAAYRRDISHSCRSPASAARCHGSIVPAALSAPNTGLRQPQEQTAWTPPSPTS
jgi:hypothetical protein